MKYIPVFILLLTSSNIFAAPATKDDIKMLIQQMDKRFEDMHKYTDKRFEDMHKYTDKRFEDMNKRFEDMNKRFEDMQKYMDKRFEFLTNILIFGFGILGSIMGFLYHRQSSMMKSLGSLETAVQAILERLERIEQPQTNLNQNNIDIDNLLLTLQNSDEQTKRKFREVLEVH